MAINLYDSPAQSTFINTYVPIKFENLYKMAENDRVDLKESQAKLDDLASMRNLNSLNSNANELWRQKYDQTAEFVGEAIKDPSLLLKKENQLKLASIKRGIVSDSDMSTMLANKPLYEKYINNDDPEWRGLARTEVEESDPTKLFNMQNVKYQDPNSLLYKKLPDTQIGGLVNVGNGFFKSTKGVTTKAVESLGDDNALIYENNPYIQRLYKRKELDRDIDPNKYRKSDGSIDYRMFARDLSNEVNMPQVRAVDDYVQIHKSNPTNVTVNNAPKEEQHKSFLLETQNNVNRNIIANASNKALEKAQDDIFKVFPNGTKGHDYNEYSKLRNGRPPLTREAFNYAANMWNLQNNRNLLLQERNSRKVETDPVKIAAIDENIKKYQKYIDGLAAETQKNSDGFSQWALANLGDTDSRIFTPSEKNQITISEASPIFVERASISKFGDPNKTNIDGVEVNTYTPGSLSSFTAVSPKVGLPISNSSAQSKELGGWMHKIGSGNDVQFIPNTTVRSVDSDNVKIMGQLRIPETTARSIFSKDNQDKIDEFFPLKDDNSKKKVQTLGYRIETENFTGEKDNNGNPKPEIIKHYYVPVQYDQTVNFETNGTGHFEVGTSKYAYSSKRFIETGRIK